MLRLLVLAGALLAPTIISAQVEPGDRVRIVTDAHVVTSRVVAADDSTMVLDRATNRWGVPVRTRPIDWAEVRRLDMGTGRRSRFAGGLQGAAVGLVGGAAGGAVVFGGLTALSGCDPRSPDAEERFGCFRTGDAFLLGALIGAYWGTPSGAIAGFLWPGDRWERTPITVPRPAVVATPDGRAGVGVSLRF